MKLIYSYSAKYNFQSPSKNIDILYLYFLSNILAKQYGYKTVMVCEKEDQDNLLGINYDEMIFTPHEELYDFPDWAQSSIHKLYAIHKMNEPFLYINPTSIFFTDKSLVQACDKDITFTNQDVSKDFFVNKSRKIIKKQPEVEGFSYRNRYYNTSFLGGKNFVPVVKAANIILPFLKENAEYLDFICGDNMDNYKNKNMLYFANLERLIDCVWLPQLAEHISGETLEPVFSSESIKKLEAKQYDLEADDGSFEIEDKNSVIFKYANRHHDLIELEKAQSNFYDNKRLSASEINKIKGFAMLKYGISFN
jgi:hypothetical protein